MAEAEVAGLRERHREGRRKRILESASELFRRLGYDATSVDAIAVCAEVSVPTIYSYFASKQDLLLGLLEEDRRQMRASLAPMLEALPADPLMALVAVAQASVEEGFVDIAEKPIWREISAAALTASPERRESVLRFQGMHVDALTTLLLRLRESGIIRDDLDIPSAARSLYAISRNCFRLYLMMEAATPSDLRAMLETDLKTVFEGFLAEGIAARRRTSRSNRRPLRSRPAVDHAEWRVEPPTRVKRSADR